MISAVKNNSAYSMIQVTPELLTGKASEVRSLKSTDEGSKTRLRSLVMSLNENWKVETLDAFLSKFESMRSNFTKLSEMLEGYTELMDAVAREMQSTDQSLKSTMKNFGYRIRRGGISANHSITHLLRLIDNQGGRYERKLSGWVYCL